MGFRRFFSSVTVKVERRRIKKCRCNEAQRQGKSGMKPGDGFDSFSTINREYDTYMIELLKFCKKLSSIGGYEILPVS